MAYRRSRRRSRVSRVSGSRSRVSGSRSRVSSSRRRSKSGSIATGAPKGSPWSYYKPPRGRLPKGHRSKHSSNRVSASRSRSFHSQLKSSGRRYGYVPRSFGSSSSYSRKRSNRRYMMD